MAQQSIESKLCMLSEELAALSDLTIILANAPADPEDIHKDRPSARLLTGATMAIANYQERIADDLGELWLKVYKLEHNDTESTTPEE